MSFGFAIVMLVALSVPIIAYFFPPKERDPRNPRLARIEDEADALIQESKQIAAAAGKTTDDEYMKKLRIRAGQIAKRQKFLKHALFDYRYGVNVADINPEGKW